MGRITDLRNNQAIVNKTINIALAQSVVMGVDRACALAGQVITNVKGPYLFYRGNVKTKKLTPDGEFSVPTQGKRQVPTRTWYTSRAPTGQMTVAAREKATALPTPLLSA